MVPNATPDIIRLSEYLDGDDAEMSWVVDGLIPEGGFALLSGRPKVGKSTLARYLTLAAARGQPWLGRDTDPDGIPVVGLWLEDSAQGGRAAYRQLGNLGDDPPVYIVCDHGIPGTDSIETLRASITRTHARLAIVDPLISFLRVPDSNDYAKTYAALVPLRELARETECAVLCVHHHRKGNGDAPGERVMGSTAFAAAVDTSIELNWDGPGNPRTVTTQQRYGEPIEERALSVVDGIASVGVTKAAAGKDEATRKILKVVADNPGVITREIREAVQAKNASVSRLLDGLEESGAIRREKGKRGAMHHYLADVAA